MVDVRDEVEQCFANTKKLFCFPRITPELSRPASGPGGGSIIAPAPRPRSGLGLNELLERNSAILPQLFKLAIRGRDPVSGCQCFLAAWGVLLEPPHVGERFRVRSL